MTCKDCLHYMPCGGASWEKVADCPEFTPRNEWVHLPCEIGSTVYVDTETWGGLYKSCRPIPLYIYESFCPLCGQAIDWRGEVELQS